MALCERKLVFAGADTISHRRDSLEFPPQLISTRRAPAVRDSVHQAPDIRKGVRKLEHIIRQVELDRH
jgi:hypothetical protein